jgi:hypothetical protein
MLGRAGWPGIRDGLAFLDPIAALHEQWAEMSQRRLVSTRGRDRHRQAVRWNLAGEGHLAGRRSAHDPGVAERDVDSAVLAAGVRVVSQREAAEDLALGRPRPGPRPRREDESPAQHQEEGRKQPRCSLSCRVS